MTLQKVWLSRTQLPKTNFEQAWREEGVHGASPSSPLLGLGSHKDKKFRT